MKKTMTNEDGRWCRRPRRHFYNCLLCVIGVVAAGGPDVSASSLRSVVSALLPVSLQATADKELVAHELLKMDPAVGRDLA